MRALILERNKKIARRLVRYLTSAGYETTAVADPGEVAGDLGGADLLAADAFDGDFVVERMGENPGARAILWTAEPLRRSLRYPIATPQISNILGRDDFESTPHPWELVMVTHRLCHPRTRPPGLLAYLDWGFTGFQDHVTGTRHRDEAIGKVQEFVVQVGAPRRLGELFGELTHEVLMNAMFDAPVDERGVPVYAMDRKAAIELPDADQPLLRVGCDGSRLALQVSDRFGRLERRHVFAGLERGLGGELDKSGGGAGLGMVVCHNATVAMFFDVIPGSETQVTGIVDLDLNLREFRTRAKSLHYFQGGLHG